MSLFYFKRILVKRSGLILGIGIVMACLIFIFTWNLVTYTASSTIYTGIGPGYENGEGADIRLKNREQTIRSENLIHILKSRETMEKTAIRLMARHLLLTKPDPAFCQPETWQALMTEIPDEVKKIVERIDQSAEDTAQKAEIQHDTLTVTQAVKIKLRKFRIKKEYYTLKAGDSPDEICMRFGLYMNELARMNNPMPPFQGGQRLVVGKVSEPYWVDSTILAQKPVQVDTTGMFSRAVNKDESRYEKLVEGLTSYKNATPDNFIAKTLQSSKSHYSVLQISSVKISRIRNSDLLKLSFDCTDPGVCVNTLKILTEVFQSQYEHLTEGQSRMVTGFSRIHENQSGFMLDSLERELSQLLMKNLPNSAGQSQFVQVKKGL
ncbi:MAG: LysM domain-containing protein, partial [Bacteroidales bacterium]|nr:LysM domain-containing protein [Bacteroidales bacterium]